jgi:hypothetical protein
MASSDRIHELVDELMASNSSGDQFGHSVPSDWPLEAWLLLLDSRSSQWDTESLHFWLAGHVNAPEQIVRILAGSPHMRVRWRIARKRKLPVDLFEVLAHDEDEGVRNSIAENKKTPREVLARMLADPSASVRRLVEARLME